MAHRTRLILWALLAFGSGCTDDLVPSPLEDPSASLPASLADLRLEDADAYEPAYPLWSNGSTKSRTASFPGGDVGAEGEPWIFPAGSIFTKTFLFGDRPIETRVLRVTDGRPEYGVYLWNKAGTAASLRKETLASTVEVEVDGEALTHTIPSDLQCALCHEAGARTVLGFDALQLGHDQLSEFSTVLGESPAGTADLDGFAEEDRSVLGYAYGNCVHCHDGSGNENASYDLGPSAFRDNTIGVETSGSASLDGIRVVAGDPEASVLFLALRRDDVQELKAMPPEGVDRRDDDAVSLFETWIAGLDP